MERDRHMRYLRHIDDWNLFAFLVDLSFYWSPLTMDALNQCSFIAQVCSTYEQDSSTSGRNFEEKNLIDKK